MALKNKKHNKWKYLNPFILKKEMEKYGRPLSGEKYMMYLVFGLMICFAFGYLFRLNLFGLFVIALVWCVTVPFLMMDDCMDAYYETRFSEVEQYIEHMLYAFSKHKKILPTLEDTILLFEENSRMYTCIRDAINYINDGYFEEELYQEAFRIIEKEYGCTRLVELNGFMRDVELNGGSFDMTADVLLEDKKNWGQNVFSLQQKKNKAFFDVVISVILALVFCVSTILITEYVQIGEERLNMAKLPLEQIMAVITIIAEISIVKMGKKKLAVNWLSVEDEVDEHRAVKRYEYLMKYNLKKDKIKSLLWAAPFFVAVFPLWMMNKTIAAVVCCVIAILMLFQHNLNYRVTYKKLKENLLIAYPKWLLNLCLLLQSNNVQVAIEKTYDNAPEVMKKEIRLLLERIENEPMSISSYTDFFKMYKSDRTLGVIQDTMKILYSVAITGNGDLEKQLHEIMEYVYQYRDIADELNNKSILRRMKNMITFPVVVSFPKLLVDIYTLFTVLMPALGNLSI